MKFNHLTIILKILFMFIFFFAELLLFLFKFEFRRKYTKFFVIFP